MEGEKNLERKLKRDTETAGGWCIKLICTHVSGLPDRLLLLPGGRVIFVEVKTESKKPRRLQTIIHKRLRKLGFVVEVVDTSKKINDIFNGC